jgi:hypothetical protein
VLQRGARQRRCQSGNDKRIRHASAAAIANGYDRGPDGEKRVAKQIHIGLDGRDKPMRAAFATRIPSLGNALVTRAESADTLADIIPRTRFQKLPPSTLTNYRAVTMLENTVSSAVFTLVRLVARRTAINPAIMAYSIAVTPWLSLRNRVVNFFIFTLELSVFIRICAARDDRVHSAVIDDSLVRRPQVFCTATPRSSQPASKQ